MPPAEQPSIKSASVSRPVSSEDATLARGFSLKDLPDSFYDDPYPTYRALQSADPVHRMPDGSFFLTRHRDLEAIYKDTTRFSSDKKVEFAPKYGADSLLFQHHTTSLLVDYKVMIFLEFIAFLRHFRRVKPPEPLSIREPVDWLFYA